MNFGKTIRLYRVSEGKTVTELAADIGVTKGYMSRIECHNEIPSPEMVVLLAKKLHADEECLLAAAIAQKMVDAERVTKAKYLQAKTGDKQNE